MTYGRNKSREPSELRTKARLRFWCVSLEDQYWVELNFEWLPPPPLSCRFSFPVSMHYLAVAHLKPNTQRESRRLKAESHSNKLHSISPSPPPVLGSLPFGCLFQFYFSNLSPASLYTFFFLFAKGPVIEPFLASVCLKEKKSFFPFQCLSPLE